LGGNFRTDLATVPQLATLRVIIIIIIIIISLMRMNAA